MLRTIADEDWRIYPVFLCLPAVRLMPLCVPAMYVAIQSGLFCMLFETRRAPSWALATLCRRQFPSVLRVAPLKYPVLLTKSP